ncbi:hypothetical protein V8C42DRAFT_336500 [Trichoderma barbatum]
MSAGAKYYTITQVYCPLAVLLYRVFLLGCYTRVVHALVICVETRAELAICEHVQSSLCVLQAAVCPMHICRWRTMERKQANTSCQEADSTFAF